MMHYRTLAEHDDAEDRRTEAIFRAALHAGIERFAAYGLAQRVAARPLSSEQGARLICAAVRTLGRRMPGQP